MIKRTYLDSFVIIAGDFNQWKVEDDLADFADMSEAEVGNTREDRCIDWIFCNMSRLIKEAGTLLPLDTEDGDRTSDCRIAFCRLELQRKEAFWWQHYSKAFKEWIVIHDWGEVLNEVGSNRKTDA